MTPNPEAAVPFYKAMVGWGTEHRDGPMPYTMFTANGTTIGGTMQMPPDTTGTPPHWIGYVSTPDMTGTLASLRQLGGNVLRILQGMDPHGGMFALHQAAAAA